jgi:hypothetical protein
MHDLIAEKFLLGNYSYVAMHGALDRWETFASLGLIGQTENAIAGLTAFRNDEAAFYSAVAYWISGDESRAARLLESSSLCHARNLLEFIRKPYIQVLSQFDQYKWIDAVNSDGRFNVVNFGFSSQDLTNGPYADIQKFYNRQSPPDFYVCKTAEWHLIPPNLQQLPCPLFGYTADYDAHIQAVHPWLSVFDELITTDDAQWCQVGKLSGKPVASYLKSYGIPDQLPPIPGHDRPVDVFISGTVLHPYHPDKAWLFNQILSIPGINIVFYNGFLPADAYYEMLGKSKICFTYIRFPGGTPSRGLESLAMGSALLVQEESILQLLLNKDAGVFTYSLEKGNIGQGIVNILSNWPEISVSANRGARIVRDEFSTSKVASQFFRFLTFLAAKPRTAARIPPAIKLDQRRSTFWKGWRFSEQVLSDLRTANISNWLQQLNDNPRPQLVIDIARECILGYASGAYLPAAQVYGASLEPPSYLMKCLEICAVGINRFPRCLVLRFNMIRTALHFGTSDMVKQSLVLIDETMSLPESYWEIDPMEDVFPFDYFSQLFNYRLYFDMVTSHLMDEAIPATRFVQPILASLSHYRSFYTKNLSDFANAVALDPDFPFYRYYYARRLIEIGFTEKLTEAGTLLEDLADKSMLFKEAYLLLKELDHSGRYHSSRFDELKRKNAQGELSIFLQKHEAGNWLDPQLKGVDDCQTILQGPHGKSELPSHTNAASKIKILFIHMEFTTWRGARAWTYPANLGLEEGFAANNCEYFTIPTFHGVSSGFSISWLKYAKDLCSGKVFDQVWIELVHTDPGEEVMAWITSIAPVRVGILPESLKYSQEDYWLQPVLKFRGLAVRERIKHMTHVLAVDEHDVDDLNASGFVKALHWTGSVPERFIADPSPLPSDTRVVFPGTAYGQRKRWLEHPALRGLLSCSPSPDDATVYPVLFDAVNAVALSGMMRSSEISELHVSAYLDPIRHIRQKCFGIWMQSLKTHYAVVNLPSTTKAYAGRVAEVMAAGRPVITWEVPNSPQTSELFIDGEDILLYPADQPEILAEQILRLQKDRQFAQRIAKNGNRKIRTFYSIEKIVRQVLDWIYNGDEPGLGSKQSTFSMGLTQTNNTSEAEFKSQLHTLKTLFSAPELINLDTDQPIRNCKQGNKEEYDLIIHQVEELLHTKDVNRAIELLEESLCKHPEADEFLSRLLLIAGNYEKASVYNPIALSMNCLNADLLTDAGIISQHYNKWPEAVAYYNASIIHNPSKHSVLDGFLKIKEIYKMHKVVINT